MMKAGASQISITPPVGIDLCGYVDRIGPSTGVHDDLFVRGLYLQLDEERLLWLHCDLIGVSQEQVQRLREACLVEFGLYPSQVIVSATHTHSGPATIYLRGCGEVSTTYLAQLDNRLLEAARGAMAHPEAVSLHFAEGRCQLARDRRRVSGYQHVDDHLPSLAFNRSDGSCLAVLANYAMHNAALSYESNLISADVAGIAAEHTRTNLPGQPVVLLTNGGSANTIPPRSSSEPENMVAFGQYLGDALICVIERGEKCQPDLSSISEFVQLPFNIPLSQAVHQEYERDVARFAENTLWRKAIEEWKDETLEILEADPPANTKIEIQIIRAGPVGFTAIGAEVFTHLAEDLRAECGPQIYVVGCANGNIGYLPFWKIYTEGGYEVDTAYKFYGNFMIAPGGYEIVRDSAMRLLSNTVS